MKEMEEESNASRSRKEFERMFTEYYTELVVYVNRYTRDTPSAEDVVQEMFCNLWDKRESLRVHTSARNFLYCSARNAVLNHLTRSRKITVELSDKLSDELLLQEEMDTGRQDKLLYEMIERLPARRRRIFKLCFFSELKYAEVASLLEISVNTVKTQMGRAMAELRGAAGELLLIFVLARK
ncbi:MAG: RNA polymerase sigma-70 factor [Odoribacteraceae bacterium]|jgi:RNA polymerase sigma-70 factor (ECF subfamily)|nr:RNA polymerase sigma-70 factor [Odoribacteraceae bacterium]